MCVECIYDQEEAQRKWLSERFAIAPSSAEAARGDTQLQASKCCCRGLRVMARFTQFGPPEGLKGTVVFEEEDGVYVVRWDDGIMDMYQRELYFATVTELGYSEVEETKAVYVRTS